MARKPRNAGPRLEALLDERDHLRIKISMAEENGKAQLTELRRQLLYLEQEIEQQWGDTGA